MLAAGSVGRLPSLVRSPWKVEIDAFVRSPWKVGIGALGILVLGLAE